MHTHKAVRRNIWVGAAICLVAFSASAEKCYVSASAYYRGSPQNTVYLDVFPLELPAHKITSYGDHLWLAKEDTQRVKDMVDAYVKTRMPEIHARFPGNVEDTLNASVSNTCHLTASAVAESRKEFARYTEGNLQEEQMTMKGDWTRSRSQVAVKEKPATAVQEKASRTAPMGAILTRVPDASQQTPEQIASLKQREAAGKKKRDEAAAAAKLKASQDAAGAKARDDKQREICMKPQHRGDCGCMKYFPPDPARTACSK